MAIQRIPVWKEMENWHKRQRALRDFLDANAALADNMISAGSVKSEGIAEIVARTALKRIQAEAAAKAKQMTTTNATNAVRDKEFAALQARMKGHMDTVSWIGKTEAERAEEAEKAANAGVDKIA